MGDDKAGRKRDKKVTITKTQRERQGGDKGKELLRKMEEKREVND